MTSSKDLAALVGRVLLAVMFVYSGYGKIGGFEGTASFIASKGLPLPPVATVIAIAVEVIGGLMIVFGWRTRVAALVVAAFTLVASVIFHNFWAMSGDAAFMNQLMFLKNLAVIGGLLVLGAFGPGSYSVDRS